jgi:hypothetical protein
MINLEKVLREHALYLRGEGGEKANLSGANLIGANLIGANLRDANLFVADLRDAILRDANLYGANLSGANLYGANLRDANLYGAKLRDANLYGANLYGANLRGANLRGANLKDANLKDANLYGAYLPDFQICPEEGSFIGWKKVSGGSIIKLLIPEGAKRTSTPVGRKCRAEYVVVLEGEGTSMHDGKTTYKAGETVRPDSYDDDIRVECTKGIHFFMTRKEAARY